MNALPPSRNMDLEIENRYWSDILKMCTQPTASLGKKVRIVWENPLYHSPCAGLTGVVRPFNPVDFKNLSKRYNDAFIWMDLFQEKLPNMSAVYDFFPYQEKDGAKVLATAHYHIERKQFVLIDSQLSIEL